MFPAPDSSARPGWACGLFVWIAEPTTPAAVRALCRPVAGYVRRSGTTLVVCDARDLDIGVETLEALAQLHLTGKRSGFALRISDASDGLRGLAAFLGLDGVLRFGPSAVEAGGELEQREQPRGVEEEHDAADPVAVEVEHLE
jgi:hypothetical protein